MSLVGTRPPTVDEYEQYEIGHRKRLMCIWNFSFWLVLFIF